MERVRRAAIDAAAGAAAGTAATVPMTVLLVALRRRGLVGALPPRRVTDRALHLADRAPAGGVLDPSERSRRVLAGALHVGFGALAGAAFALGRRALPGGLPDPALGAAHGLAVWASAYLGWVPAMGALPRADEDRSDRTAAMVAGHLVYGVVLGATLRVLRPRS
ncbi:DUF6789 family protein [Aquipuribacter sp. SD81]|uniref:DUF6789 family protein n=1 Tax=Aquipuribacter sp. SD81 TaxID=3127703 RepID=UPI00301778A8